MWPTRRTFGIVFTDSTFEINLAPTAFKPCVLNPLTPCEIHLVDRAGVLRCFKLGDMQVTTKLGDGMLQIVQHLYLVCLSLTLGHFPNVVVKSSSVQSVVSEMHQRPVVFSA